MGTKLEVVARYVRNIHRKEFVEYLESIGFDKQDCDALGAVIYYRRANVGRLEYAHTYEGQECEKFYPYMEKHWYEVRVCYSRAATIRRSTIESYKSLIKELS